MRKIKNLAFIALILIFLGNTSALAAESDYSLGEATFEAESTDSAATAEILQLQKTIELLRSDLVEMKSGMKQLQAKMVEAEMEKLRQQLETLQNEISAEQPTSYYNTPTPTQNYIDLNPESDTPQVTSIGDFLDIDMSEIKPVDTETTNESEEDLSLEEKLTKAETEIEELKTALAEKEALDADKAANAEIIAKTEAVEAAKDELENTEVADAVAQAEGTAEEEGNSNIIAKADGEILFQFPRSLSRKSGDGSVKLKTASLTADVLEASDEFKRESAPKNGFSFFSVRSITILGGLIVVVVVAFIVGLVRYERKLLAATSRRFQQLDVKPDFDLHTRAQKAAKRSGNKRSIIQ